MKRIYTCIICLAGILPAQDSGLRIPVTGFIEDPATASIRTIRGIPESAVLSDPASLPALRLARVAPHADFALAATGDGSLAILRNLASPIPSASPIDGAIPNIDRIVFNEPGTAAVLYSSRDGRLQLVSGLPDHPAAAAAIPTPAGLVDMALAWDASFVLASASDGTSGSILQLLPDGTVATIANAISPGAIAFVDKSHDFAYIDAGQIIYASGDHSTSIWLGPADIQNPVAMAMAEGKLWVAAADPARVIAYDPAAQSIVADLALPFNPTSFRATSFRGVFLLNDLSGGPLFLLATQDTSLTWIPAPVR